MADKRSDGASKALGTAAALGAGFVARKVMTAGWKRATGKEPPTDPQDPTVGLVEALGWAIVMGVVLAAVRVVAIRAASGVTRRDSGQPSGH
jgi:hypothetical protein